MHDSYQGNPTCRPKGLTKENKIFVVTSRDKILGIVIKRSLFGLESVLYSTKPALAFVQDTHPDSGFAVNLFR